MVSRAAATSAAAVALALVVHIGSRLFFKWRRGRRYDGLDSAIDTCCSYDIVNRRVVTTHLTLTSSVVI